MRYGAQCTILDSFFIVAEISAAFITEGIKRAITKQTVEIFLRNILMAGEIFAIFILKELIMFHTLYLSVPTIQKQEHQAEKNRM